jgi:hypothetical protein
MNSAVPYTFAVFIVRRRAAWTTIAPFTARASTIFSVFMMAGVDGSGAVRLQSTVRAIVECLVEPLVCGQLL